jgi:hypothetical protein
MVKAVGDQLSARRASTTPARTLLQIYYGYAILARHRQKDRVARCLAAMARVPVHDSEILQKLWPCVQRLPDSSTGLLIVVVTAMTLYEEENAESPRIARAARPACDE